MTTLTLMHGLPGSGKTTIASKLPGLRVSRDDIRVEVAGPDYWRGDFPRPVEQQVTEIEHARIVEALVDGSDVTSDSTNLNLAHVEELVALAWSVGARVQHHPVSVPLPVAHHQNQARGVRGGREVPGRIIEQMARSSYTTDGTRLRTIASRPGLDKHGRVKPMVWRDRDLSHPDESYLAMFNRNLPRSGAQEAVIFDMDGTLADVSSLVERYLWPKKKDFDRFHRESEFSAPIQWVLDATHQARAEGKAVLVVTARKSLYASPTINWLLRHEVPVEALYMRGHDDLRPDTEIKRDIATEIAAAAHRVTHAFEDSPEVLALWGRLGIPATRVPNPQWDDVARRTRRAKAQSRRLASA